VAQDLNHPLKAWPVTGILTFYCTV
jgi:hypothetical protein